LIFTTLINNGLYRLHIGKGIQVDLIGEVAVAGHLAGYNIVGGIAPVISM